MSTFSLVLPKTDPTDRILEAVKSLGGKHVDTLKYKDPNPNMEFVVRFETVRDAIVAFKSLREMFPGLL